MYEIKSLQQRKYLLVRKIDRLLQRRNKLANGPQKDQTIRDILRYRETVRQINGKLASFQRNTPATVPIPVEMWRSYS